MRSRPDRPDFAKLARRSRGLRRSVVLALGLTTAIAGCVDLAPPWQGDKQDAVAPTGSGGAFILVDASAVGGNAGDPGPIEGLFPTDAPVSSSFDSNLDDAEVGGHLDTQPPDAARVDAKDVGPGWDGGALAGTDSDDRDAEKDVSVVGSGGAGGSALDAGSGGTSGSGGVGGHSAMDAADVLDLASGSDSGAGGNGTGGTSSGGNTGTGTGGTGTGGGGSGGTGTGGSAGGVCAGYHGRDAGSGIGEGQIAYYRCESAAGNSGTVLEDSSGQGHDATLYTGTGGAAGYSFVTGKVHDALHLVAAQQGFVTLPDGLLDNACEVTIATWVWLDSSQKWQRIFDFGRDSSVYMFLSPKSNGSGKLRFAISLAGIDGEQIIDGTEELPTGAWYHVAVVLGPAGGALYVNASKVGSNADLTLRPADLGNLPNLYLGRSQFSKDPYYDGNIDSFRIYDRALSDAEIREAYAYDGT
jgi:hypothetical protein